MRPSTTTAAPPEASSRPASTRAAQARSAREGRRVPGPYCPGDRPERFDKAWATDADEIIIDLEDSVARDRKAPVHPAAFTPRVAERAWAARVLAALERAAGGAAVAVDGRMVDRPVWLQAQRIANAAPDGPPTRLQAS